MSDNTEKSPEGEHIDELLSQLKGIFGHLSDSEKEESKQKIAPPTLPSRTPPASSMPAAPSPNPAPFSPDELMPTEPADAAALESWVPEDTTTAAAAMAAPLPIPGSDGFTPTAVNLPEGTSLIPAAIFHPTSRMNEAKIVAEKVERITPKFTKVAFVLNVQALSSYDPKADLLSSILAEVAESPIKAVFLLLDKSLDEPRRKVIVAELETRGIYFQEIPFHQVEKKAIYTDMLLGMVFFFDSRKSPSSDNTL